MNLRDFLSQRSSELDAFEAPLREQLSKIALERDEIAKALRALDDDKNAAPQARARGRKSGISQATIKGAILHVLGEDMFGSMKALEILQGVNVFLRTNYPRTSLSPQLSRLKSEGRIVLNGNQWCLAPRPPEDIFGPPLVASRKNDEGPNAFAREPS